MSGKKNTASSGYIPAAQVLVERQPPLCSEGLGTAPLSARLLSRVFRQRKRAQLREQKFDK